MCLVVRSGESFAKKKIYPVWSYQDVMNKLSHCTGEISLPLPAALDFIFSTITLSFSLVLYDRIHTVGLIETLPMLDSFTYSSFEHVYKVTRNCWDFFREKIS